jgi:hypothetical protein
MSIAKEALERLHETLSMSKPLLNAVTNDAYSCRQAYTDLQEALTNYLEVSDREPKHELDFAQLRQGFSALMVFVGPGDQRIRNVLLKLLKSTQRDDVREFVLDCLPSAMPVVPDKATAKEAIDIMKDVLHKHQASLLPVLGCCTILPLDDCCREDIFGIILQALPLVTEHELPAVTKMLIKHITNVGDAQEAWVALRAELRLLKGTTNCMDESSRDPETLVAHVVLINLKSDSGIWLEKSYFQSVEKLSMKLGDECVPLDAYVLLDLLEQSAFIDSVSRLLDSWLHKQVFPFDTFINFLETNCESKNWEPQRSMLYDRLVRPLLRLSVFLLLSPVRIPTCTSTTDAQIFDFILRLHHNLDREHKDELIHCLLHVSAESAVDWNHVAESRKRKEAVDQMQGNVAQRIQGAVNGILKTIATQSPEALLRFKHVFVERLTAPTSSNVESIKDICRILSRLVDQKGNGMDTSELMMLLQKLLFASSRSFGRAAGDSTQVVRGLILATELISSAALNDTDRTCVKDFVLRILLPTTRRMVDPELGSPGLDFLKVLIRESACESSVDTFHHFKQVLANTGLIQILEAYKQNKSNRQSILAYDDKIPRFFGGEQASPPRPMIFCLAFFLRRSDMSSPTRWKQTAKWVFELVDTYLKMGREVSPKGWHPDGWLRAAIEFPDCFHSCSSETRVVGKPLFSFDIAQTFDLRAEFDISKLISSLCAEVDPSRMASSILNFSLALWTGVALSAAVFTHSFQHCVDRLDLSESRSDELVRLIQFQIAKIYDMRRRLWVAMDVVDRLGGSYRPRSKSRSNEASPNINPDRSNEPLNDTAQANIASCIDKDRELTTLFFETNEFIQPEALWACLIHGNDVGMLKAHLYRFSATGECATDDISILLPLVRLKTEVACHLVNLLSHNCRTPFDGIEIDSVPDRFFHCLDMSLFTIHILPSLRLHFAKDMKNVSTSPFVLNAFENAPF